MPSSTFVPRSLSHSPLSRSRFWTRAGMVVATCVASAALLMQHTAFARIASNTPPPAGQASSPSPDAPDASPESSSRVSPKVERLLKSREVDAGRGIFIGAAPMSNLVRTLEILTGKKLEYADKSIDELKAGNGSMERTTAGEAVSTLYGQLDAAGYQIVEDDTRIYIRRPGARPDGGPKVSLHLEAHESTEGLPVDSLQIDRTVVLPPALLRGEPLAGWKLLVTIENLGVKVSFERIDLATFRMRGTAQRIASIEALLRQIEACAEATPAAAVGEKRERD